MPELPEVETMVRGLRPVLVGGVLTEVEVLDPFLLRPVPADEFVGRTRGAVVERVERRGKWVVVALGAGRGIIVIQPRMSGGFWRVPPGRPEHIRLIWRLEGERGSVWFCDTRRLGQIAWYPGPDEAGRAFERSHGPDALVISADELAERLARTRRAIKPALLDQKVVAGIGNIYADEVLSHAGIHPGRPAAELTSGELERTHRAIGAILNLAIEAEGSSFDRHYRTVLGAEGGYLARHARVYGREGLPCVACGTPITKTKVTGLLGRPTHFCPRCQRVES